MNRKTKLIALVIAILMAAIMLVSCADKTDWANVSKSTEVAQVNDYVLSMDYVKYYYAEQYSAQVVGAAMGNEAFGSVLGDDAKSTEEKSAAYSDCIDDIMVFAMLHDIAEAEGVAIDYDEGRERAYEDLILLPKQENSGYYSQYLAGIKTIYVGTDDVICDVAGELYRLRESAYKLVNKYFDEGKYASEDEAVKGILAKISEASKGFTAKRLYPGEKNVNLSAEKYVKQQMRFKSFGK